MRLFAALPLPPGVQAQLTAVTGGVPGLRWLDPDNYHITLRFFGSTPRHQAEDLAGLLDRIAVPELTIALQGLGQFGDDKRGRQKQLYADVVANRDLAHLQRKIEQAAQQAGFEPERRKFHPHVTLARYRQADRQRLDGFLSGAVRLHVPPFQVGTFHLYESFMHQDGAIYTPLVTFGGT